MDTHAHLHVYMCVHTNFYLYVCVCIYKFIWKPKYHWKRERLEAGKLVYLVAQVIEDERQRGWCGMNGYETIRDRIRLDSP